MTTKTYTPDITRVVLAVLLLGLLISASFIVLQPFLLSLIWAAAIVIACWPLMLGVQRRLGDSRALAVVVMISILALLLMLPLIIALSTIISNVGVVSVQLQEIASHELPEPPEWLGDIPLVGPKLVQRWQKAISIDREEALTHLAPFIGSTVTWIAQQIGSLGLIVVHFILTIILTGILFAKGDGAAQGLMRLAGRLAPGRGEEALVLAGQAIRAVANGVILTALLQALMTIIGLLLAGVPHAVLFSALTFLLGVIQIGAGPVLIGVVVWLFYNGATFAAWAFLIWSVMIMVSDNFIRPFLIKRGANLPLILIFAGVIGGLLAFGVIGIFVGPVVLAVTYTLLGAWTNQGVGSVTP